ncbi:hypothetical protein [Moorena sp. SIO4G3]|uniref:hypothetical protein n=1 Tax=Moorena sp. SIO4G3 TaxID=2607821 RepID=UPI00142A3ECA|nr:hypothetical protein [Moorena sp. SIO4G3]NEO76609.1 hypothetical protein [Moorena sp. SIO4G3]
MGETPKTALHRYYLLPITLVQMFCISDMLPIPPLPILLPLASCFSLRVIIYKSKGNGISVLF